MTCIQMIRVKLSRHKITHREVLVDELKERILAEGQVLGGGILKVDSFVNLQVDPLLMDAC